MNRAPCSFNSDLARYQRYVDEADRFLLAVERAEQDITDRLTAGKRVAYSTRYYAGRKTGVVLDEALVQEGVTDGLTREQSIEEIAKAHASALASWRMRSDAEDSVSRAEWMEDR